MRAMRNLSVVVLGMMLAQAGWAGQAPRQMENLTRGLVAVRQADGSVFLSWRLLGTDPDAQAFNVFQEFGDIRLRVNDEPIRGATHITDTQEKIAARQAIFAQRGVDPSALETRYVVRPAPGDAMSESDLPNHWEKSVPIWENGYLEIPLRAPDGGTIMTPSGEPSEERDAQYLYRAHDASVGDLTGDGDYDIVLQWEPSNAKDNSFAGYTGPGILEGLTMQGKSLWRIHLGKNIRTGEHYTQFMVYDLDGDGIAEIACKTADGTVDGAGNVIGDPEADWRTHNPGNARHGRILDGPEYLTIFDGRTGAALATVDYNPPRGNLDDWGGIGGNGGVDNYGNRVDRFLACVAYLDGVRPSLVMCRGVYGRTVLAAWDWREGKLTQRWVFDSGISHPPFEDASPYSGMGGHSLSVGDVDGDGRDEIVYQAMTVDDDGAGLYSTMRRHGDAMFLSDLYPDRPGLETFLITENENETVRFQTPGAGVHDARTGEAIWTRAPGVDIGRGVAADIDPRHRGWEAWFTRQDDPTKDPLIGAEGQDLGPAPPATGFMIWWDGDPLREFVAGGGVAKWNWETAELETIFEPADGAEGQGRRRGGLRANLVADILGDWREELVTASPTGDALRIYTTTIPSDLRLYTLMHDPQYRLGIAWQNVVYNKPACPGYYLGHDMDMPPRPNIMLAPRL